jgi:hypothetical protein
MPRLENWREMFGSVCGNIYDDEKGRWEDGTYIHTSQIVNINYVKRELQTRNTVYTLGEPARPLHVDPVAWDEIQVTKSEEIDLATEVARLREALSYYASKDLYDYRVTLGGDRPPAILKDRGRIARLALANRR